MVDPRFSGMRPGYGPYASEFVSLVRQHLGPVRVTSVVRSRAKQAAIYAQRQRDGGLPAAPPGHSLHELGAAFDMTGSPAVLKAAGLAWEKLGFTWGGRFQDPVHFDFRAHR